MTTVVVSIEGVLTEGPTDTYSLNYEASSTGRALFQSLRASSRLVLLSQDPSRDRVKSWLSRENLTKYADLVCRPTDCPLTPPEWRVQKAKDLVGVGFHIAFVVDADPDVVKGVVDAGVCGLLYVPSGVHPGKQDKHARYSPWYDLVETIEKHALLRASSYLLENESDG